MPYDTYSACDDEALHPGLCLLPALSSGATEPQPSTLSLAQSWPETPQSPISSRTTCLPRWVLGDHLQPAVSGALLIARLTCPTALASVPPHDAGRVLRLALGVAVPVQPNPPQQVLGVSHSLGHAFVGVKILSSGYAWLRWHG